ncbi:hypothetical protein COW36_11185 [bacterium (Candidatus Blackallbacteria) CG17_big_fil_post_rev_8_21_14_2_50_48_46]|uniref:HTH lysR-type domain-containing protein n=1 Tax=bacterium (Candidatus Blackallbacteria) CG17_big_fil_post_rev_8_21_14_2_50_48_46 TaxID=2014261 RepID=A0A2M7G4I9_9BACT|nr:MAG: hypothetical protein COW64_18280 [bacterium (Candidatus Blackallbacteria) CG18_big_fil_WC_8_21_14_2_50_49_26]PIW16838.1 MAG: hypothetical protein COW36_11185 [bacterium (Candidatus Blackallbacteria) CG17_big_fil_post_rev_8_21_14_2_50_48_46]PIW48035.1 MAG: hypothetical protein COW20_10900 [bacterium (Candidatus Blackallbacteria) CG13_big_fil_rev_8_21_14_2_50_49_14]
MKIQWLYFFSVLADCLNVSQAAESLNVTPVTLQKNMRQLEKQLGVALFNNQLSELTDAGEYFKRQALELLIGVSKINQVSNNVYPAEIRFGWSDFWGRSILLPLVSALRVLHPQYLLNVQGFNRDWHILLDAFQSQLLDVVLTTYSLNGERVMPYISGREFELYLGPEEPFQIVSHPQYRGGHWSDYLYGEIESSLALQAPFPLWNQTAYPRQVKIIVPNVDILKYMCQHMALAAFLPASITQKEQSQGKLAVVAEPPQTLRVRPALLLAYHSHLNAQVLSAEQLAQWHFQREDLI